MLKRFHCDTSFRWELNIIMETIRDVVLAGATPHVHFLLNSYNYMDRDIVDCFHLSRERNKDRAVVYMSMNLHLQYGISPKSVKTALHGCST